MQIRNNHGEVVGEINNGFTDQDFDEYNPQYHFH